MRTTIILLIFAALLAVGGAYMLDHGLRELEKISKPEAGRR